MKFKNTNKYEPFNYINFPFSIQHPSFGWFVKKTRVLQRQLLDSKQSLSFYYYVIFVLVKLIIGIEIVECIYIERVNN